MGRQARQPERRPFPLPTGRFVLPRPVSPELWPGRPRPIPGETPVSWLQRVAHAMRRDLEGFRRDFLPGAGSGLPGLDDGIPTPWLPTLAARTGLGMKDLEHFSGPGRYVPPFDEGDGRPALEGVA